MKYPERFAQEFPPSNDEIEALKTMFSRDTGQTPAEDGLVYMALGFDADSDYTGMARAVGDRVGIQALARAEARLLNIEDFDMRKEGSSAEYAQDTSARHTRMVRIGALIDTLDANDRHAYFEAFDEEEQLLLADPATKDLSLLTEKPPEE